MQFDFEADLRQYLYAEFSPYGIKLPVREGNKGLQESLIDFLTLHRKLIPIHSRKVDLSPELLSDLPNHPKREEIEVIAHRLKSGQDVNIFQSKRVFELNFHDHLAYEWDIYHLHLSLKISKKINLVKQVNQLLFVYITTDRAILLGTDKHKTGIFGETKWQEILHDHFPETIEKYKDNTILNVKPDIDGPERQEIWNKGYTLGMTKIRDQVYINPGIGRTTSGHSSTVVMNANEIYRWLFQVTEQFSDYYESICSEFNYSVDDARFKLRLGGKHFEIYEEKSGDVLLIYPNMFTVTPIKKENLP